MALITDATTTWSAPVTLAAGEIWLVGSAADATFESGQGFGFILIWGNDAIASIIVGNL